MVSSNQAAGMGGAGKPAGGSAANTFQNKDIRQLVMLVRFKPKPAADPGFGDTSAAAGMIQGATGAVNGAVDAVDSAMSSIPGLNMLIKEDKTNSSSQSDYKYDYSKWDARLGQFKSYLQQVNPLNIVADAFEFSSTDAKGRQTDAQTLMTTIKGKISGWAGYTVWVQLIGLGQGGNVINECTDLLSKDGAFQSEKWCVKSVIYVGTALYRDVHVLNPAALKGQGTVANFGSKLDLTQHAVEFFEPQDKLLQLIKDANKNTLSLTTGKIQMRVINILAMILGGLNLSPGHTGDLNKFGLIKDQVVGMVGDTVAIIKKIITDTAAFVQLGKLPEFAKMLNGYGDIPHQSEAILETFFTSLGNQALSQAKKANVSLGPKDLAGALACLCPLFDHLTASMALFSYDSKTGADLAQQIISNAGVTTVYAPLGASDTDLSKLDTDYQQVTQRTIQQGKPDPAFLYVAQAQTLIGQAADKGSAVSGYTGDQQIALAEAIYFLARPMTLSKEQVYKQLLDLKDQFVNFGSLKDKISATKTMAIPGSELQKLNVDYPQSLKDSMGQTDAGIDRIKGYFDQNNYDLQEDSQYFIFNAHNVVFSTVPEDVAYCLDQATGVVDDQRSKGFENQFTKTGQNQYVAASPTAKNNVLPAQTMPTA